MMDFGELEARFPDQLLKNEPLSRYTVARLGGAACALLRATKPDDIAWAARWAHQQQIPWIILGGGANVLASDAGYDGLVIVNLARRTTIDAATGTVDAESGASLSTLARHCMSRGVKGLEWGVSVPGTVGGAVVNNAGAHGGDMAGNLHSATILDVTTDTPLLWSVAEMQYAYRHSALKGQRGRYVVLKAQLQLEPNHDPAALKSIADGFVAHRKTTQPPGASLGSMFKNPPGDYAGRLIEAAGLKGYQIGGVQISPVHANFFVNVGKASAADYWALIALAQQTVAEKFGVALELEIERIGDW